MNMALTDGVDGWLDTGYVDIDAFQDYLIDQRVLVGSGRGGLVG